ncbi:papain family cysteine protease [Lymphocystis disease virus 4]|uniref:Papain family cysteine protease n=1 Tax=Lymphocystis disease virus 4 TaxID=2704413 RepID=A0A6B9XN18_9VIRU|nr:papain family cysteine protease [Lymphocystis disease virus 4]QHR78522.1 papain family cysteine protease [Lymphocystis disease virus 4]
MCSIIELLLIRRTINRFTMPESFINICDCELTNVCKTCLIWLIRVKKQINVVKNIIRVNTEHVLIAVSRLIENDNLDVEFCFFALKKLLINVISQNKPLNQYELVKTNGYRFNYIVDLKKTYDYFEFVNIILKYCEPVIFDHVLNELYTLINCFEQIAEILQADELELILS